MNRSKDLRGLFRQTLINKRNSPKVLVTYGGYSGVSPIYGGIHKVPSQYGNDIQFSKEVRIYFYEWSDVTQRPRCFYSLDAFEKFLNRCGIFMESYQREIINNLGIVYASCYNGSKELNVRGSYKTLIDSMHEYNVKKLSSSVQPPKLILEEPRNRWPEKDGTFFG